MPYLIILDQNIIYLFFAETYELALIAKKRRKDFNDTESEAEYNKNHKVNRREIKKRKMSDDFVYDLNDRFDKFEVFFYYL